MTFDEWWEQTPPDFHIGNYTEEQMCKIAWEAAKMDMVDRVKEYGTKNLEPEITAIVSKHFWEMI